MAFKKKTERNEKRQLNPPSILTKWRPNYDPTEQEMERLAQELLDWSDTKEALKMSQFHSFKAIDHTTYDKWCDKYPVFGKAHEVAFVRVANNREIGALTGELNSGVVLATMGMYDKSYRSYWKWKKQVCSKDQTKQQDIKVVIEAVPHSDKVPKMED